MTVEKSCGAVVFRGERDNPEYLLILNRKGAAAGHWGFPKGHVEGDETEHETAVREIFEETGLEVEFMEGFRQVTTYMPKPEVVKDVVYFLARAVTDMVALQAAEVADYKWCGYSEALKLLSYDNRILKEANQYLNG
ncbi:MAG TPA: NUDIX domain-containing protein [Candidatus Avimonoglobus intestinipullorum]|uniref:Bis(5'-nucleosyl)-tetraphosphatase [asymmetrical] n=1 Tax=Candidatus Avimonoglobus intestinipullorum TaxID=2840699 RepID=A0A9D1LU17_9FIRM|nr:NUDIX domain-containing protein [Candidatus Avimonoglobus intestinipullorum]